MVEEHIMRTKNKNTIINTIMTRQIEVVEQGRLLVSDLAHFHWPSAITDPSPCSLHEGSNIYYTIICQVHILQLFSSFHACTHAK